MELVQFFLHLDKNLAIIINTLGPLTYGLLFTIIFAETGLVIAPFLPGDSLLFVVGTLAGTGLLNIAIVYVVLLAAAILGDTANYWLGHHFGAKVFSKENSRLFNKAYLAKTEKFYEKHGGKTIILARFIPIIRTFAPFVAGIGKMHYGTFLMYNFAGGLLWVTFFTFAGYFFGSQPFIKDHFELAVVVVILVSIVPVIVEYFNHKKEAKKLANEKTSFQEVQKTFKKEHLND